MSETIRRRRGTTSNEIIPVKNEALIPEVMTEDEGSMSTALVPANTATSALDNVNGLTQVKLIGIKNQIFGRLRGIRRNIYEIGRLLSVAEHTFLDHGQFMPWIRQTFGKQLPYSTAWLYMKIYETFKENPKVIVTYPLSVLMCMIQEDFPEDVKIQLEDHAEELADRIDIKKFKRSYAAVKKGKMTVIDFWAETKGSVDVAFILLRNDELKRGFDNYVAQLKVGLSRIDKGINLIKMMPEHGTIVPEPEFREYYDKEFDTRIESLQKLKREFMIVFDSPSFPTGGLKQISNG